MRTAGFRTASEPNQISVAFQVLGYILVAVAFLLQPAMKWLCDRLQGAVRLVAVDVFLLLSLVATVNVWRGIWNLLNIYLLPGTEKKTKKCNIHPCWQSECIFVFFVLNVAKFLVFTIDMLINMDTAYCHCLCTKGIKDKW